jgi:hypothetical protein
MPSIESILHLAVHHLAQSSAGTPSKAIWGVSYSAKGGTRLERFDTEDEARARAGDLRQQWDNCSVLTRLRMTIAILPRSAVRDLLDEAAAEIDLLTRAKGA